MLSKDSETVAKCIAPGSEEPEPLAMPLYVFLLGAGFSVFLLLSAVFLFFLPGGSLSQKACALFTGNPQVIALEAPAALHGGQLGAVLRRGTGHRSGGVGLGLNQRRWFAGVGLRFRIASRRCSSRKSRLGLVCGLVCGCRVAA